MTTLYLIRHAEAEGNIFRRVHGWYDSSVTPNGLRQIAALQKRFETVQVDVVYASDLIRTCTTAGAVWKPKGLTLHTEPRFREVHMGVWEDAPFGQVMREQPEVYRKFAKAPQEWAVEGSERYEEFTGRFLQALDEIARQYDGQSVAIFSHGMVLQNALGRLFFGGDTNKLGHSENTAVSTLHYENGAYRLESLFDASHLPKEISTVGRQSWWRREDHRDMNFWYRPAQAEDAALLDALGIAPGARTVAACLEDEAVGAVSLQQLDENTGAIVSLGLLPAYRGQGLAAQLLGYAVSAFRKDGLSKLTLLRTPEGDSAHFFDRFSLRTNGSVSLIPRIR